MIWRYLVRPILFRLPAESIHHLSMGAFHASMFPPLSYVLGRWTQPADPALRVRLWDREFSSPVGLAAGFDKEAKWFNSLRHLGFSHIEVGTITGQAQPGNPMPRLFRLPADQALINRMGFNNPGADAIARQLKGVRIQAMLGINIGKSKVVPLEQANEDYRHSFRELFSYAEYFTVNVSSPNTPGLRTLQAREPLVALLNTLQQDNKELAASHSVSRKPLLLKIAPDLNDDQLADIAAIATETGIDGIIATNTTLSREGLASSRGTIESIGDGGLSGAPLTERSRTVIGTLYQLIGGRLPLIGAGGIMSGEDAWQMICHGASLVQVYTGFIYGGPLFVAGIHRHLSQRLRERGLQSIANATGSAFT